MTQTPTKMTGEEIRTIQPPEYSEWYYSFSRSARHRWIVERGDVPNAFYRFIQRIILGIYWGKQ